MRTVSRFSAALALAAGLMAAAGCSSTTAPGQVDLSSTVEYFVGPLDPGASSIYTFTALRNEFTQVTLMWVTAGDLFAPLDVPLEIKLGLSRGTTCDAIETTSGRPRFQAHIGRVLAAGSYCIELTDTDGLLPETAGVIARIVHPPPTSVPNPATVSSASVIQPGGSASLSFEVQSPGTVTATLRDLSIDAPAGLGMGLVNPEGTECLPSQAKVVSAGSTPHFSVPVDPGRYCVAVFDVGNFQAPTTYTLEVAHP